jgi:hypothetical protein
MDLLVVQIEWLSRRWHDWLIQVEAPAGTLWRSFLDSLLDAAQDQLARGATLAGGSLVEAPMQVSRKVDAGADRSRIHKPIIVEAT